MNEIFTCQDEHPSQSININYGCNSMDQKKDILGLDETLDNKKKISTGDLFGIDLDRTLFRYPSIIDDYTVENSSSSIKEDHVIDNIYISDYRSNINYYKYKLIINCDYPNNNALLNTARMDIIEIEHPVIGSEKIFYIYAIGVEDSLEQNLLNMFDEITEVIKRFSDKKVLVHCHAGVSRSASFILAYLIRYYNMSLITAYEYLKNKRVKIDPNKSFLSQLLLYQIKLKK